MQFTMSTKRLATTLKAVMPAVGVRSSLPALTGVRIEATDNGVVLTGTDLEATARCRIHDVRVEEPGVVITPAKPLAKALAAMASDEISIEDGPARVVLEAGTRTITLDAYPVEDFPTTAVEPTRPVASVRANVLADALARAVLCASRDEARPVQTSVALFVEEGSSILQVVATDSYRMGLIRVELSEPAKQTQTLLLPARVCKELARQMRALRDAASIGLLDRDEGMSPVAVIRFDESVWTVRLIEGEFPNWRQIVLGETGAAIEFDIDEMTSVLKGVKAVANGGGTPVRLRLGDETTVELVEQGQATIRESLASAVFSPNGVGEIEVAFNPGYLADALKFVGAERTTMWVRDGLKPALIGRAECRYVLMAVRLT